MLLLSTLVATLGVPSSDLPFVFRTRSVEPPLREVRFSGGKRGRYLVRGDRAGEVTLSVAVELLGAPQTPAQAAELVDTIEPFKPLTAAAATKLLGQLGATPTEPLEAGEGKASDRVWVVRLYARTTLKGGGELVRSRFEFGLVPFSRTDQVLFTVEPVSEFVPSAPPPARSSAVDAFWAAVNDQQASAKGR